MQLVEANDADSCLLSAPQFPAQPTAEVPQLRCLEEVKEGSN